MLSQVIHILAERRGWIWYTLNFDQEDKLKMGNCFYIAIILVILKSEKYRENEENSNPLLFINTDAKFKII